LILHRKVSNDVSYGVKRRVIRCLTTGHTGSISMVFRQLVNNLNNLAADFKPLAEVARGIV